MSTPRNRCRALLLAVACLSAISAETDEGFGEQIDMSWQATDSPTAVDGDSVTREGTATFANGEKAHIVNRTVHPLTNSWTGGTGVTVSVYKFDDGSTFTLRSVSIWNVLVHRTTGLFSDGTGRFAGMMGSATGGGEAPGSGPITVLWTGTYELPKK